MSCGTCCSPSATPRSWFWPRHHLASSAIFALLHIGPKARHLPWTVSSFGAGLLFGGMFLWTGDLTGPVLAHFLINFLNLRHVAAVELH